MFPTNQLMLKEVDRPDQVNPIFGLKEIGFGIPENKTTKEITATGQHQKEVEITTKDIGKKTDADTNGFQEAGENNKNIPLGKISLSH